MDHVEVLCDDCLMYNILGTEVKFYSDETSHGWNVIASINGEFQYLGNDIVALDLAVFLWERKYNRKLSDEDLAEVIRDNRIR